MHCPLPIILLCPLHSHSHTHHLTNHTTSSNTASFGSQRKSAAVRTSTASAGSINRAESTRGVGKQHQRDHTAPPAESITTSDTTACSRAASSRGKAKRRTWIRGCARVRCLRQRIVTGETQLCQASKRFETSPSSVIYRQKFGADHRHHDCEVPRVANAVPHGLAVTVGMSSFRLTIPLQVYPNIHHPTLPRAQSYDSRQRSASTAHRHTIPAHNRH